MLDSKTHAGPLPEVGEGRVDKKDLSETERSRQQTTRRDGRRSNVSRQRDRSHVAVEIQSKPPDCGRSLFGRNCRVDRQLQCGIVHAAECHPRVCDGNGKREPLQEHGIIRVRFAIAFNPDSAAAADFGRGPLSRRCVT